MKKIFNKDFFKAALVRAIKTVAQTALATIGTSAVLSAVDWKVVISASVLAGILSILTSFAGLPEVKVSEIKEVELTEPEVAISDIKEPEPNIENK